MERGRRGASSSVFFLEGILSHGATFGVFQMGCLLVIKGSSVGDKKLDDERQALHVSIFRLLFLLFTYINKRNGQSRDAENSQFGSNINPSSRPHDDSVYRHP